MINPKNLRINADYSNPEVKLMVQKYGETSEVVETEKKITVEESAKDDTPKVEDGVDINKLFDQFLKSLDTNNDGTITNEEINAAGKTEDSKKANDKKPAEPGSVEAQVDEFDKKLDSIKKDINHRKHNAATSEVLKDLKGDDLVAFMEAYDKKHGEGEFLNILRDMMWGVNFNDKKASEDFQQVRQNFLELDKSILDPILKELNSPGLLSGHAYHCGKWITDGWVWL